MSGFKQPQDRKPTAQEMMASAVKLQGANMAQKATLDLVGGKLVLIMAALKRNEISDANSIDANRETLEEIRAISSLTREQVAERRAVNAPQYPDVAIQAVINEAADKIADILLPKGDGE